MTKDMMCLLFVIVSYALGHFGGYRLCKLRVKNMLRRKIQTPKPVGTLAQVQLFDKTRTYSALLTEVMAL